MALCRLKPVKGLRENLGTGFHILPPEILLAIIGYLSSSDKAFLMLCNHYLFRVSGGDSLQHLQFVRAGTEQVM